MTRARGEGNAVSYDMPKSFIELSGSMAGNSPSSYYLQTIDTVAVVTRFSGVGPAILQFIFGFPQFMLFLSQPMCGNEKECRKDCKLLRGKC